MRPLLRVLELLDDECGVDGRGGERMGQRGDRDVGVVCVVVDLVQKERTVGVVDERLSDHGADERAQAVEEMHGLK